MFRLHSVWCLVLSSLKLVFVASFFIQVSCLVLVVSFFVFTQVSFFVFTQVSFFVFTQGLCFVFTQVLCFVLSSLRFGVSRFLHSDLVLLSSAQVRYLLSL